MRWRLDSRNRASTFLSISRIDKLLRLRRGKPLQISCRIRVRGLPWPRPGSAAGG
jgi:hypothetical protein